MLRKRATRTVARDPIDGEFLSLLAHELRNPLAPIRYAAAALRMRSTSEADLNAIATIDRSVALLARLVDDLIDGARLQRGDVRLEKQWVDIGTLAQQALEAMRPVVEQRGQHLEANLPTEPVQLECDPIRLKQIVGNLLENASQRTQAGGTLTLTVEGRPQQLLIRIGDNGLGIAPEDLPHVFNMYRVTRRTPDSQVKRLGVGLAVARSLVELHGGAILAHSNGLGRGSTLEITLPVAGTPPRRASNAAAERPRASLRVLVVEDNLDAAQALAELLTMQGHVAATAHDGASALGLAQALRPAVVLLDICLPDIDGYEVARRIRATDVLAHVRLIAVTARDASEDARRARQAGFDGYLTKPVSIAALHQLLSAPARTARESD
jgi:CheY-like chemotaxis protein